MIYETIKTNSKVYLCYYLVFVLRRMALCIAFFGTNDPGKQFVFVCLINIFADIYIFLGAKQERI